MDLDKYLLRSIVRFRAVIEKIGAHTSHAGMMPTHQIAEGIEVARTGLLHQF